MFLLGFLSFVFFWGFLGGGGRVFFSEGRFDCFLNFLHYVFIVGLLPFVIGVCLLVWGFLCVFCVWVCLCVGVFFRCVCVCVCVCVWFSSSLCFSFFFGGGGGVVFLFVF